ncbi:alpha/beta hydrolase [Ktedonosporobacter rubrisoli]|uniref:Alpha/beta hydrolase n=1 Tax=Ktedonosporobacter rubrisoli TaxID=2509675 RepID=A0A4P6JK09_KTERU|nr:alpha/beta fold hydrolase [Ktedonosporobacter rubrisoli]QBD75478.1 alpha/beta hydrolase [Ktedonosporobacter rubrisoli]
MDALIVLVHSPLVGPFSWSLVAEHLQNAGFSVLVPTLTDSGITPPAYWQQYAASLQQALAPIPQERPLILIGHSGAGYFLPVLAQATHHPIKAYIFADAGLPHPDQSQLDELQNKAPAIAQQLRQLLTQGASFPDWKFEEMGEIVPDENTRRLLLAEMQPRSFDYFAEVMPSVPGWPDAPCAYLLFTQSYLPYFEQAHSAGWPCRRLEAQHFHMLVDPVSVSTALVELIKQIDTQA